MLKVVNFGSGSFMKALNTEFYFRLYENLYQTQNRHCLTRYVISSIKCAELRHSRQNDIFFFKVSLRRISMMSGVIEFLYPQ